MGSWSAPSGETSKHSGTGLPIHQTTKEQLMSDNSVATPVIAKPAGVSRILLDTDIAKDVDDVGALATLHALADLGEAEILAILVSCANPHSAPCASAINEWYGRGDIPLGVVKGKAVLDPSQYAEQVATELPGPLKSQEVGRASCREQE